MGKLIGFLIGVAAIAALIGLAYYQYRLPEIQIAQAQAAAAEAQSVAAQAQAAAWESVENTEETLKFLTGPTSAVLTITSVCVGGLLVILVAALVVFGCRSLPG